MRYFLRKGLWKSPVILTSYANEVIYGVSGSLFINLVFICILNLAGREIDFSIVFSVLSGSFSEDGFGNLIDNLNNQHKNILLYFFSTQIISAAAGLIIHSFIRSARLDLKVRKLKFDNEWYYLLSGEKWVMDDIRTLPLLKRLAIKNKNINRILKHMYVMVSAVVNHGSVSCLYWGTLDNYHFNKKGQLDRIELKRASRRDLLHDYRSDVPDTRKKMKNRDPRYYDLMGNSLIINYSDIKTLNVEYRFIKEKKADKKN